MDNYKTEIISACILAFLFLLRAFQSILAERIVSPIKKWLGWGTDKLNEQSLTSGRTINNLLVELRVKMNADRASIFLFHNGQHFNPKIINNSIWKFTSAYETCKAGVSYESGNMQNLLVTNNLMLIDCLWGKLDTGCTKYDCKGCPIDCTKGKNLIAVLDVEVINYGNTKSLLENQGVKKFVVSPIIISDDYVGFIGISYNNNFTYASQTDLKLSCEYANLIGYQLANAK